jgi:hypothetical protein
VGLERHNLGGGLPAACGSEGLRGRAEERFGAMQLSERELSLGKQRLGCGNGDGVCCCLLYTSDAADDYS